MRTLICGSVAYDTIMVFRDRFKNHILPDQIHLLNVSFLVPDMRRDFGGCAVKIAYTLKMLGGDPLIMASVGQDFQPYAYRLDKLRIQQMHIRQLPDAYTAQAFITTDLDDNQITAFHPGAMSQAHENTVPTDAGIRLAIVSPDGRDAMISHAEQLHAAGIPFVFDPGQGLPMFNGDELAHFVELATWVTVNDYEGQMLCDRTGLSFAAIAAKVKGLIVTLGEQGCEVWEGGRKALVSGVEASEVLDPTGCGDAFRAALLHGLLNGWDLARCATLGNRMGATKIASRGGQNYRFDGSA